MALMYIFKERFWSNCTGLWTNIGLLSSSKGWNRSIFVQSSVQLEQNCSLKIYIKAILDLSSQDPYPSSEVGCFALLVSYAGLGSVLLFPPYRKVSLHKFNVSRGGINSVLNDLMRLIVLYFNLMPYLRKSKGEPVSLNWVIIDKHLFQAFEVSKGVANRSLI